MSRLAKRRRLHRTRHTRKAPIKAVTAVHAVSVCNHFILIVAGGANRVIGPCWTAHYVPAV